jgi:hypothetical protein
MAKNKSAIKSPAAQEREQYNAFLQRFRTACDLMAGKGFCEQLPKEHLPQLFRQRLPPLRLEFATGVLTKAEETDWHERFRLRLTDLSCQTLTGEAIPVAAYFRDGLLLANYAATLFKKHPDWIALHTLADTYGVCSPIFLKASDALIAFVNSLCIMHSDIKGAVMTMNYTATTILGAGIPDNRIKLNAARLRHDKIRLDGQSRDMVALEWTDLYGKLVPVKIAPAKLGFGSDLTKPVTVYCQQHAIARLFERLSIYSGTLLYFLEGLFYNAADDFKLLEGQLLPLRIAGKKLGYLVVDLAEDKLVIRTFLFLTNDGTPEGRKLAALTRLKKLDKQYLGIDTMAGFSSLAISDNSVLSQLFTEAGCGNLLDLKDLHLLLQNDATVKGSDALLRYLENSPFMRRR